MGIDAANEREALLQKLADFPDQLTSLVAGLTLTQLTTVYSLGEWTVAQNVHHIFDSHARGYLNCKLILTEEEPPLKRYQQDAWAQLADGSAADISHSLFLIRALHMRWVVLWQSLTDEQFARGGRLPNATQLTTIADLLAVYVAHGPGHYEQIVQALAAGGVHR